MAIPKLTEMLQNSLLYTDPTHEDYVPLDKQHVFLVLAEAFQAKQSTMYMDAEELTQDLNQGDPNLWEEFLNLDPVILYSSARTKRLAAVTARKSIKNLQQEANRGNVKAIEYLNEVSGILQAQDGAKLIVLTTVPRPELKKP
jgi:hypothetical protein